MHNKDINQLKKLKEKLENQEMSVLVGAGFSKNVSGIFPSWWELLYDMAYYLFKSDIVEAYEMAIESNGSSSIDRNEFIDKKIDYYISKTGYLEIVSEYIKRKGYREAITNYIEERTPKIIDQGKYSYLEFNSGEKIKKVKITDNMLSQHKLLLQLPWNNIYTTNYDELLELSDDATTAKKIRSEIKVIDDGIKQLLQKKSSVKQRIEELNSQIDILESKIGELNVKLKKEDKDPDPDSPELHDLKENLKELVDEKNSLTFEMGSAGNSVDDKERELLQLNKALSECIFTVTHSSELGIKRNKNIIKLHGSLRNKETIYGFDGDIQKQYVIAKEDYESYPTKHEAFTQLMRISLLQESYCLVGFSGDDTNFLEWIKWVREVLNKGKNRSEDFKIYFINVGNSKLEADKLLFFENHKVYPIHLMEDHIINFMEDQVGVKLDKKTKKAAFELLFKFLKGKQQINKAKLAYETLQRNKLKRSWESLGIIDPKKIDWDNLIECSKEIEKLKKYNKLPSLNFAYSHKKHKLLHFAIQLVKDVPRQGRSHLLNLLTITIKDTYLCPQDFVWDEDGFNEIEAIFETGNKGTHRSFLILMLRSKVLRNDSKSYFSIEAKVLNKTDDSIYESILLSAFNLDFKTLRNKLDAWNPNSSWVMKKAGLLALFDNREAIGYLSKNMENPGYSSQEELYMLEMLSYLKQSVEHRYDRVLSEAISGYKNMGLDSVSENIDNLIDDANKGSGKIERYGEGRFRISNGFSFSNDFTKPQKGLQFLQQMIETGFPISVININWKNPTKCYPLFRTIFEYFPFPTAFYALQFSNEKFLRRLGQDFAYSDNLKLNLDKILATVLNSYLEDSTPNGIKQNILYFASELFIAVDPKTWQDNFLKIWNIASFKERCLDDRWFAERTFTISCIKFIQNPKILTEFLHTLLINPISDYSVYLTFYLAKNPIIKKLGETLQSNEVAQAVDTLINSMHQNESAVFMTGNLYDILTDSQKANIRKNIQKLDFEKIENLRLWRVLIYFSTDDNDTRYKIKTAIIKNKKLFNAGFTKNSLRMGADFIEISKFTNTKAPEYISWSTTEAKEIFKRLLSELKKIDGYSGKSGHDFISILSEMQTFLNREQSKIKDVKEYNMAREKVDSLYIQSRGYESLSDGIISTENTDVVWALSELSSLMYQKNSIQGLELEISSLLNKVLLQSEPSLEACLNYFASWLNDEQLSNGFKKYDEIILKILKRYSDNELQEFDKPFVYEQLVGIANTLSNWGMIDDSIEHWKTIEKQTSYNNIRFKEEAK